MSQRESYEQPIAVEAPQLFELLNSAREILILLAPDGTILFANETSGRALDCEGDQLVGQSIYKVIHPNSMGEVRRRLERLVRLPGDSYIERWQLRSKDGSWRWFETVLRSLPPERGFAGLLMSARDITDMVRMEAERQVISDIVHALNQTSNLDQLLASIHQALKKILYAENCFVALHEPETNTFHFPFFADQFDSTPPPQKVKRTCTSLIFRTGCAMLIPQSKFDALVADGEVELVGSPSPAWLGVPLKTPIATIGVLVVQHYQDENAFGSRDLEFLDSVGGHIALAIERRRAEDALRKSESTFRLLFAHNPLPTWVYDSETLKFLQVNDAAVQQYGYSAKEFLSMTIADIRGLTECVELRKPGNLEEGERYQQSCKHRRRDGTSIEADVICHRLEYAGRPVRLEVAQNVGERQRLEQQLRQAQKMEAIGRLAGGVAHDFNNLLMVIKGHTELLLHSMDGCTDQAAKKIEQIDRAADRAASLTRQLLAFSRMQVLQPRAIDLNEVIKEMDTLIPRMIGEDIELVIRTASNLGTIRADASQMEQVIMNLAVNARDAMPGGGRLVIETSNAELDRDYSTGRPVMQSGSYVLLAVSDSGMGMDAETQARIFEPFFTTKEQGKGTGLGLATVYGVVKQSGGFIWVYSEVGKGTSFKIYLPRVDQPADKAEVVLAADTPGGSETILLAEDEQDVRDVAREFLESAGYTVLQAASGAEAMRIADGYQGNIDLLVTDMVMPGMTGQRLAVRLRDKKPGLGVIYMSGYTEHTAAEEAESDPAARLLTKPFSRSAILRAVRDVIGVLSSAQKL
jgi:two-component system, cell cycle sensor histidine kinase and response regulator CckA